MSEGSDEEATQSRTILIEESQYKVGHKSLFHEKCFGQVKDSWGALQTGPFWSTYKIAVCRKLSPKVCCSFENLSAE